MTCRFLSEFHLIYGFRPLIKLKCTRWKSLCPSRDSSEPPNNYRFTGHVYIMLHQPLTSINMTPQESSCLTYRRPIQVRGCSLCAWSLSLSSMYLGFSSRKLSNQSKVPDPATSTAQPMNFAMNVSYSTSSSCMWLMRALCNPPMGVAIIHLFKPFAESDLRWIWMDLKSALWSGDPGRYFLPELELNTRVMQSIYWM